MKKKGFSTNCRWTTVMVLAFVICHLSFSEAQAQVLRFGVKGGLDVTDMKMKSEVFEASNRMGWFIGPTLKLSLPVIGFDISALYNQREAKIETNGAGNGSETLKTQQIAVPLNARISFGIGQKANIFAFAGPQIAFNIGGEDENLFDQASEWTVNSSNFSINLGAGVLISHLQISANYNVALGNTGEVKGKSLSQNYQTTVDKWDSKYNAWQLALAYYF